MITPVYNENGLAEKIAFEIYDETAEDWVNGYQYLYTYLEMPWLRNRSLIGV